MMSGSNTRFGRLPEPPRAQARRDDWHSQDYLDDRPADTKLVAVVATNPSQWPTPDRRRTALSPTGEA